MAVAGDTNTETSSTLRKHVAVQLAKMEKQEDSFLDLVGDPDWPKEKIADRLRRVREERDRLRRQLTDTKQPDLGSAQEALERRSSS